MAPTPRKKSSLPSRWDIRPSFETLTLILWWLSLLLLCLLCFEVYYAVRSFIRTAAVASASAVGQVAAITLMSRLFGPMVNSWVETWIGIPMVQGPIQAKSCGLWGCQVTTSPGQPFELLPPSMASSLISYSAASMLPLFGSRLALKLVRSFF